MLDNRRDYNLLTQKMEQSRGKGVKEYNSSTAVSFITGVYLLHYYLIANEKGG